jgi:DNA-binding response OmpR family regulator
MKVLIVEDELLIAKVYTMHLKKKGHDVLGVCTNPVDAEKILSQHTPDIILMDVQLKGGADGISFARKVRESMHVPILFTTGNSYTKTMEIISDIPHSDVMTKPVEIELLVRRMHAMTGQ